MNRKRNENGVTQVKKKEKEEKTDLIKNEEDILDLLKL